MTTAWNRHNRNSPNNSPGIHLLRDASVARRLVTSAAVTTGDLVVEFGAGTGALTAYLERTGARVIAVEDHPRFVRRLERRFAAGGTVRVVAEDARAVPLPNRPYSVVASIPYAISTQLLRRLLGPDDTALVAADLVVEWGFAKRVTSSQPRNFDVAWWQARFDMWIAARVPARSFQPSPQVDSAHLVVRRRPGTRGGQARRIRRDVRAAYGKSPNKRRRR
ncbi:methyltransferase domain-containing protein [Actinobacteria bacterium YIM 96077]|uniref:Dimethyladenosine transferase n=1 Tax=Phytoactinopolyspora halophila TaxID=1981511 RepID=A0A329QK22_9ACTN|nr:rRNA adenine N(6)-methyltransferase family protein [Phytoactinopolyspora halophila]AYY13455.1 methyltransferase domain-containing protein [Actinobacteria bacterium YIM 96077]RAW10848.1 dimethyladenosine transferase [Phytoactinopolyspora halophila]